METKVIYTLKRTIDGDTSLIIQNEQKKHLGIYYDSDHKIAEQFARRIENSLSDMCLGDTMKMEITLTTL